MIRAGVDKNSLSSVKYLIEDYQVVLRPIVKSDIEQLRLWRNSATVQAHMLDQREITAAQQAEWFEKIQHDEREQHWLIFFRDKPIGSINLKCVDDSSVLGSAKTVFAGLYIGEPAYQANIIAFAPSLALYDFCFECLSVTRFKAVVKASNQAALNYNERLGYRVVGGDAEIEIVLDRAAYTESTGALKALLSRGTGRSNILR